MSRRARPTVVDLFAGAGLLSHAFKTVGFSVIRAIEQDSVAAATYARNLGTHVEIADVTKVKPEGRCDVLVAGPPCQGFSTLGLCAAGDPRNRLSLQVARWAEALRAKVVVIENVVPFLASQSWKRLTAKLEGSGYSVSSFVLNAAEYGCAQIRLRSFTIATRGMIEFQLPAIRNRIPMTVREAWEGLPSRADGKNHHVSPKPSDLAKSRFSVIPTGGDKRDVMRRAPHLAPPSWWKVSNEVTDAWGRLDWDQPSNTLRTCFQNASKGRYIHPSQPRVISLREAARLHSIPDEWQFEGLPTQIARQIGNSVPPKLGVAVAKQVMRALAG